MKYTPKIVTTNHNVAKEHPLKELGKLLGGSIIVLIMLYVILGSMVDIVALNAPPQIEDQLLSFAVPKQYTQPSDQNFNQQQQRLQKILDRLTEQLPQKDQASYHLKIIRNPALNAMAVPGHNIIVLSGTLNVIDDDNSLAFVLAHELGHFAHRDLLRGMGRGMVLGCISLVTLGKDNPVTQVLLNSLSSSDLHYQRNQELEADTFALELMSKAGYNPNGATHFMVKLKQQEAFGQEIFEFFSTHPVSKKRLKHLRNKQKELN